MVLLDTRSSFLLLPRDNASNNLQSARRALTAAAQEYGEGALCFRLQTNARPASEGTKKHPALAPVHLPPEPSGGELIMTGANMRGPRTGANICVGTLTICRNARVPARNTIIEVGETAVKPPGSYVLGGMRRLGGHVKRQELNIN